MTFWPFRRRPASLPPDQSLRMCCLQMANGDIAKAIAFRDWIVDGMAFREWNATTAQPQAYALSTPAAKQTGRVIQFGDKPGPSGDAA